jgi:DNA-binding NtrC family response regulator
MNPGMDAAPQSVHERPPLLVVDDEPGMRMGLESVFRSRGWQVESVAGQTDALVRLRQRRYGLVISDVRMPDGSGFEVMRAAQENSSGTSVILLTAHGTVPDAVAAIRSGACEYITKPVSFESVLQTAERAVSRGQSVPCGEEMLVGSSPAFRAALEQARLAAASDGDILIQAESGTGKELFAQRIHSMSARRPHALIAVNCAALPESLLESELFGHARGAFTGAWNAQAGKFQLAQGGTLLLDEIGELPLGLQPKLLRALQEREFFPLGERRPVKVNLRIIATTNRPLEAMVNAGQFRADLYHRLSVLPLHLPPLRERRQDIRDLTAYFLRRFAPERVENFSAPFLAELERHPWPGNVRELMNVVRRALAFGETAASVLSGSTLAGGEVNSPRNDTAIDRVPAIHSQLTPGMSLADAEKRLLELTLASTNGNRARAAVLLGISLRTVRNKIRAYHLPPRSGYVYD